MTGVSDISVDGYFFAVPVDFHIALARIRFSHHILIHLKAGDLSGVGEGVLYRALPHEAAYLYRRLVQSRVKDGLPGLGQGEQEASMTWLTGACPALACAVDTALWDLRGKSAGRSVGDLMGGPHRRHIPITEQIFIRDWPTAQIELAAILARGTRRLKVKIGIDPRADLETIRRVRAFVGPEIKIRVDVNHAYSLAESEPLYRALADLDVLALEEPLHMRDWSSLRLLRRRVRLPVILDESILSLDDLQAAIAGEAIDVLNIKLTRLGGISQALRYAELCHQHGVRIVLGCNEELGVGMAAIANLASALPEVHSTEGTGPLRLGFDVIAEHWNLEKGMLALPEGPGLGVTLPTAWAAQLPGRVRCFNLCDRGWRLRTFSYYARWFQRANNLLWRVQRRRRR